MKMAGCASLVNAGGIYVEQTPGLGSVCKQACWLRCKRAMADGPSPTNVTWR